MARGITATISVAAFRADWLTHMPMLALCERYSVSRDQIIRLKHVWHLPPRHDRRLRFKPKRAVDPTTTEIRSACLRIQATWDEQTRIDRMVTKPQTFTLRRIELDADTRQYIDDTPEAE